MRRFFAAFAQHRLLGGAFVLAVTQLAASLAGLIRDNVLAGTFQARGELGVVDVYIAAFRPSDFLLQVFILSAMGTVLVPMIAHHRERGRQEEAERLLGGAVGMGALAFGSIALLLAVFFPRLAPLFVDFRGDQLSLYITFARIALLTNFLFVFGNAYGQYLIIVQRYWIYGLTPVFYTLGTIAGTLLLTPSFGALGPILGTLGGAIVYVFLRLWAVYATGASVRFGLWHPDVREMGLLMLPRMAALGAIQLQLLFFDKFASGLDTGFVVVNAYARNFQSVIVGVAGIAVAQSAFALMSQAAARGERQRFLIYVRKGVGLLLLLTVPGALLLALLSAVAARLVHITELLAVFRPVLWAYAVSVPFESVNHLLLRGYYATKHTLIPALVMAGSGVAAVTIAWLLLASQGIQALAIGYSAGAVMMTLLLAAFLPLRLRTLHRAEQSE